MSTPARPRRQKNTQSLRWSKVYVINYNFEKFGSVVKFRPFGDIKTNFKKIGWPRPEKSKLEKGWFGSKHSNTTLRVGKKQGLLNLLACHLAISWG